MSLSPEINEFEPPPRASAPWQVYGRLLGYALRYKGRLAVVVLFSAMVAVSTGSMILTAGTSVNILYMDEASLTAELDAIEERVDAAGARLGRAPGLGARIREAVLEMRNDRAHAVRVLAFVIVGISCLGAIARFLQEYYAGAIGAGITADLNKDMFDNLLNLSHRFFDSRTTGEISARFTSDSFSVNYGLVLAFSRVFREPTKIFVALGIALSISVGFTFLVIGIMLPLVVILGRAGRHVREGVRRSLTRVANVAGLIHEFVTGISVIKTYRMEAYEQRRMGGELDVLRRELRRVAKGEAFVGPATEVLLIVAVGAMLILSERQIAAGNLHSGDLVILFGSLGMALDPLRKLTRLSTVMQKSVASAERVFEYIDYRPEVASGEGAQALAPVRQGIRFEDVRFAYEEEAALDGVTFEIPCGEMVALVGLSGAGKSTVARLIPRFYDVTGGRITIDGVDIRDVSLESLRDQIGIVTQETILFTEGIRLNVAYGREDVPEAQVLNAAKAARADEFIRKLPGAYDARLQESGKNLSGGQRQRLAIARAILKDAPILILDEATSNLDTESERAVMAAMDDLVEGRTTLVIAHRLSTVQRADRIVVLEDGRVAEEGTHEQLLARGGIYSRLYRLQFADAGRRSAENE